MQAQLPNMTCLVYQSNFFSLFSVENIGACEGRSGSNAHANTCCSQATSLLPESSFFLPTIISIENDQFQFAEHALIMPKNDIGIA